MPSETKPTRFARSRPGKARKYSLGPGSDPGKWLHSRPAANEANWGDKRLEPRAPLSTPSALQSCKNGDPLISHLGHTLNISSQGALVIASHPLPVGEPVVHFLRLNTKRHTNLIEGKVVWSQPQTHGGSLVGIAYFPMPSDLTQRIETFIQSQYELLRKLAFLLALNKQNITQSEETRKLLKQAGNPHEKSKLEARDWTRQALALFRHKKKPSRSGLNSAR